MRLPLGQVQFGLCTHLFLPELVVTSAWCAHATFQKQSPGILLVFKEALIQFAVAILRSVWTWSALMGKRHVCNHRCASESRFYVKVEDEDGIKWIWQDKHMLDRFYPLVLRAEVGLLNFLSEIVTQIRARGNLRAPLSWVSSGVCVRWGNNEPKKGFIIYTNRIY